jgi:hypothetical protein
MPDDRKLPGAVFTDYPIGKDDTAAKYRFVVRHSEGAA